MAAWLRRGLERYPERHDDLAADETSRLSPYLHLGCLSAAEVARRCGERPGADAFVRQLCWRDFSHQATASFPAIARDDYRPRHDRWDDDDSRFAAWTKGRTGYPLVDAGMRQLRRQGWMHNRARLVTASFLVKDLYRLAPRRGALPRVAGGRRHRQQLDELAMGSRHRQRHAPEPGVQPRQASGTLRPGWRLRAPLGARGWRRSAARRSTTPGSRRRTFVAASTIPPPSSTTRTRPQHSCRPARRRSAASRPALGRG